MLTNLAYITHKLITMHKNGIDINEPARRSMQEKTILPYDYQFDAMRIVNMYTEDMKKGYEAFMSWRADIRRKWREQMRLPSDDNDKPKD